MELEPADKMEEIPNLFNMQMSELLREVRMKQKRREKLTLTVDTLKDLIMNMDPGKEHKLNSGRSWLKDVKFPLEEGQTTKGTFHFLPPVRMYLGGSTVLNTCVQPSKAADLIVEMPKECFQAKDWLNQRYVRKRALYLSCLALALRNSPVVEDMKFTLHRGDCYRPLLVLSCSVEGKGKPLIIHLHAIPEEGVFKTSRFHISKNNIRPRWFNADSTGSEEANDEEEGRSLPGTALYNSSVLTDVCHAANAEHISSVLSSLPHIQDAIALTKIWAHQREMDVGFGGVSGVLVSAVACCLVKDGVILPSMNKLQALRIILTHISKSQWLDTPIVLCEEELGKGGRPSMAQFLETFDVVCVDVTGFLNLALGMTKALYLRLVQEADTAVRCLANNQFDLLFMTPCPFHLTFDLTFTVSLTPGQLRQAVDKLSLSDKAMDRGGPCATLLVPPLLELLEEGLGDRVHLVHTKPVAPPVWSVTEAPPVFPGEVTFGATLHSSNCLRLVDRGPPANVPEAVDFRKFWGEKSELRRFKDGGICEAVVWAFNIGLSQKRGVCAQIVSHVLSRHAGISADSVEIPGSVLEKTLHVPRPVLLHHRKDKAKIGQSYGTGEERVYEIRQALEEFGKTLRKMDLSLRINTVSGIHPVFRFSEPFPAHPVGKKIKKDGPLSLYTPAMTVVCGVEGSGHWPDDVDRLRDLKTLYLVDLGHKLKQLGHHVTCTPDHIDVLQSGYVFRLKLGVRREVGVLRTVRTPEGMIKMEDTPQALALENEITALPLHTTIMQGIQQDHPCFCVTVRVVKRWMSAHLLLSQVTEILVEKVIAHLFLHPLPYSAPGSALVGLLRFLQLTSSPEFKVEQFRDKWSAPAPAPVIMNWWRAVAAKSLQVMLTSPQSEWKVIFKPPMDSYDLVLHLRPTWLARGHQALDPMVKETKVKDMTSRKRKRADDDDDNNGVNDDDDNDDDDMPVVDFDPACMLVKELKELYGDRALIFHDQYGGDLVAVLFKPQTKKDGSWEEVVGEMCQIAGDMVSHVDLPSSTKSAQ